MTSSDIAPALMFRVGTHEFSVLGERVEAVVRAPTLTAIPGSPDIVAGVMNFEGSPIVAVRPPTVGIGEQRHAIVVSTAIYGRFAIVCDWVDRLTSEPTGTVIDPDALAVAVVAAHGDGSTTLAVPSAPKYWILPK